MLVPNALKEDVIKPELSRTVDVIDDITLFIPLDAADAVLFILLVTPELTSLIELFMLDKYVCIPLVSKLP